MIHPSTIRRRLRQLLLLMSAAALLAPAAAPAEEMPKEVRIGWQKGAAILVLARKQQSIETRLKKLGVASVQWVEFQFGPPMLEAMGAGAVDIGSVGDTPPVFAQAGGSPLVYAAATPSAEHAVLVPATSPIRTLADLRGKRVAYAKGSSAHYVALRALALAGLEPKDVQPVALAPADATAAFNGGQVDAWVVWDPYVAIAQQRYGARVIADTSDPRLVSSAYYMANRSFAERYPTVLSAIIDELGKVTAQAARNRAELAQVAAQATGIDEEIWRITFDRAQYGVTPVSAAQVAQQQKLADTFLALGIVPRKVQVQDIVWHAPGGK